MASLKEQLKKRPSVSEKWAEVKDVMATHIHGKPPEILFRTRRPLESTNDFALDYRLDNFQPITKQPFNTAISGIIQTADHIYVDIKDLSDETSEYLKDEKIKVGGKTYSFQEWVIRYVGRMVESDPNAVAVVLPLHPLEDIIPDYREELPSFNSVPNEAVRIVTSVISSDFIHKVDDDELIYNAGEWVYKVDKKEEHTAPYYWMLTKDSTQLIIPYQSGNDYEYKIEPWYQNDLDNPPFVCIGNNPVTEEIDGDWQEYNESTFSGAVAIANSMLGVASDEQICMTRFVYPEKFASYEPCHHPSASVYAGDNPKFIGQHVIYDTNGDCSSCPSCGGLGSVKPDTSPLGTHIIAKADLFSDTGQFIPPLQYITPPLDSPKFLNDKVSEDYQRMERALFIMNQNMTNQSGESKGYDVRQKVTVISGAVKNIYNIDEKLLNSIQGFLNGEENVTITLPPDLNIKNAEDLTMELVNSRGTSSVYTSELTKELLLKKYGNDERNRKVLDFLEVEDKLWGMTIDEILKLKAIYGNSLTQRDQTVHDKGWVVLQRIANREDFLSLSDDQLMVLFNAEIDRLSPPPVNESPIA